VSGDRTQLEYLGVAAAVYWLPAMAAAAHMGERKGRPWLIYGLLGWLGVFVLGLLPPTADVAERLRHKRQSGMGAYKVVGPDHAPRHVRVPMTGPGPAGLRSSLATSAEQPRLRVTRRTPRKS
jgi:hypothetical protein